MARIRVAVSRLTALLLPALLVLAGCSATPGGVGGTEFVRVNGAIPAYPLLPTDADDPHQRRVLDRIFAGLVSYDAMGTSTPEVAESIETVDNRVFRIRLEPGWQFTDGSPVTAHSFVDAWNYGASSTNGQALQAYFAPIEGYEQVSGPEPAAETMSGLQVVDDTEFVVRLKVPNGDFVQRLGFAAFYPLPAVAFEDMAAFGRQPIGNGPYVLAGGASSRGLDLVPNPDYRGNRVPQNRGLRFIPYPDLDAAYRDLLAGKLDVLDAIPPGVPADDDLGARLVTGTAAQNQTLNTPLRLPHFGGEEGRLRRLALSTAIDRAGICARVFGGSRVPARDFTSASLPGFTPGPADGYLLEYNPKLARHLWVRAEAIAPWRGRYTVAYNADGDHRAWVEAVAENIRATLGIDVVTVAVPTFAALRGDVDDGTLDTAFRAGRVADHPSVLAFLEPYLTGAPDNDVGYSNRDFDGALTAAQAAPTPAGADALGNAAQRILLRDMPVIPLWNYVATVGHSAAVTDVVIGWNGQPDYERIVRDGRSR